MASTPCRGYAAGSCRHGARCRYSHDVAVADNDTSAIGPPDVSTLAPQILSQSAESEELFKRWRFKVPKDDIRSRQKSQPLGSAMSRFFQDALQLTDASGATMQSTITTLATNGGLIRVRELLSQDFESMDDGRLGTIWRSQLRPFLMILTHRNVISSLVIETQHVTLLNSVYGIDGRHAVELFKAMARCLVIDDTAKAANLELCLAALAGVLQHNDAAKLNVGLKDIANVFLSFVENRALSRATERHLRSIRMSLALKIPDVQAQTMPGTDMGIRPTFTMAQDKPGQHSEDGPRHDNDFASIQDIQILPTMSEIVSTRLEYLPRGDPADWHLPGMAGLLDRHFRLVREDTVGQLRDAAKFELERLRNPDDKSVRRQGVNTHVYHDVRLENVLMDNQKGMLFVLSFEQPRHLQDSSSRQREDWWEDARRLPADSLICLLSNDGKATFLVVDNELMPPTGVSKQAHKQYTRAASSSQGFVIAQLTSTDADITSDFLRHCTSGVARKRTIIEFPGVVLPAFEPTLRALQHMSQSLDIPFAQSLIPNTEDIDVRPPAYAMDPDFEWSLESMVTESSKGKLEMEASLRASSLDEAQQKAVQHALTHRLALIQGPPGTGKSYTGIKLIRTLVDHKAAGDLGPIICVCYTNHALDQLLLHLTDAGVDQVVRIGSRSKSEKLASVNLRALSFTVELTKVEKEKRYKAREAIHKTAPVITAELLTLQKLLIGNEEAIATYLKDDLPHFHQQLFRQVDENGFRKVLAYRDQPLRSWLEGHTDQIRIRSLEELQSEDTNIFELSSTERRVLSQSWLHAAIAETHSNLQAQLDAYQGYKDDIDTVRGEIDLRILSHANVVGLTTTGLARNLKYLRKLTSKVLVVEEAGEVLEAHLLTAMLPSLEHIIMIGDHQQLRPKVQNYDLSVDNPRSQVDLDVSLFERLVAPSDTATAVSMPFVTLETQRRMHPAVSNLIRSTLYPNLQDDPSVFTHPEVVGMRQRLFWFDHDVYEDDKDPNLLTTSQTNTYEVEMVAALVRHLVRQGVYAAQDIAVLTPYLGQLRKLRRRLGSFMDIVLNELDVGDLVRHGDSEDEEEEAAEDRQPSVTKGTLLQALRLATVDNFQGEEAKVVIISLVRSNGEQQCGFLRTSNRINVLLSRAQHGMYIIGNAETTSRIPMWQSVLQLLKADGNYGTCLELCCPRHPEAPLPVSEPSDFVKLSPEAGCSLLCAEPLPCGHACPSKCHAQSLHNAVSCMEDCERSKKACGHACQLPCGELCQTICTEVVKCDIQLGCGHRVTSLACWQYQEKQDITCEEIVERIVSGCGHKIVVPCVTNIDDSAFQCINPCATELDCGHYCTEKCNKCRPRADGKISKVAHGSCRKICGHKHSQCQHSCNKPCHHEMDCPPCKMPCMATCAHGRCPNMCCEPCEPCTKPCASGCPHSSCEVACCEPCNYVPCSLRCEKDLSCGHQCPSLCGETCPEQRFCQICALDDIKHKQADLIFQTLYADVVLDVWPCIFLPCGHFFTFDSLDAAVQLFDYYEMDEKGNLAHTKNGPMPLQPQDQKPPGCPECGSSLLSVARYGRPLKHATSSSSAIQLAVSTRTAYHALLESLCHQQEGLAKSVAKAVLSTQTAKSDSIRHIPCIDRVPAVLYAKTKALGIARLPSPALRATEHSSRYQAVVELRHDIWNLQKCQDQQRPATEAHRQDRSRLMVHALLMRCDLIILTDIVRVWGQIPVAHCSATKLRVDLEEAREQCNVLHKLAINLDCPIQQVEADIFWSQLAALEVNALHLQWSKAEQLDLPGQNESQQLKLDAESRLKQSQVTLRNSVGTCVRLEEESNQVNSLLGRTVSGKFRVNVNAMITEFDMLFA